LVEALLAVVLALSLFFIYTDGFQDGSSVSATAIGCRALTPVQTVAVAATFEFLGALFGGSAVAYSVVGITNWPARADLLPVLFCGLSAAILWNYLTRLLRLPSSSTHALFGGILGAVFIAEGSAARIIWGQPGNIVDATGVWRVGLSLFVSPVVGIAFGYATLQLAQLLLIRATTKVNTYITGIQWLTVAVLAFSHGANDSQKAMGVIMMALKAAGLNDGNEIPLWVRIVTGLAISLGVASLAPGIVKKVGSGIFRMRPLDGLASQVSAGSIILGASLTGGPVSTTQVISSSVMGVGAAERFKGVHWLAAQEMLIAWFLTIPGTALTAAVIHEAIFFLH